MTTTTVRRFLACHPFLIGLLVRVALGHLLPYLLDDGALLPGVRYTDVDLDVFVDASDLVAAGRSPYGRHTYRYTPFLAALLSFRWDDDGGGGGFFGAGAIGGALFGRRHFGRMLFCLADAACGSIVAAMRRKKRSKRRRRRKRDGGGNDDDDDVVADRHGFADALWWAYNPYPIHICTRGSAESLAVLLPVLATLAIVLAGDDGDDDDYDDDGAGGRDRPGRTATPGGRESPAAEAARACAAGIVHGIGVHAKLYPIIYTASFMASLSHRRHHRLEGGAAAAGGGNIAGEEGGGREGGDGTFPWTDPRKLIALAALWFRRLFLSRGPMLFLMSSGATFAALTHLAVRYYGKEALDEGLLYHLGRLDHRHNYSAYWYWIYLARGREAAASAGGAMGTAAVGGGATVGLTSALGRIGPLVPQALLLGFASLGLAPYDLEMALFVQTFAFVTFNKVITAQYFLWYLCLLPLCADRIRWKSARMALALAALGVSVGAWLGSAYCLEMLGRPVHRYVWMASMMFFAAKVNLLSAMIDGYRRKTTSKEIASRLTKHSKQL